MPLLQEALTGLVCNLVVSSSWRHYYGAEQLLGHFPPALRSRIIGFTGNVHNGEWARYQEIQDYVMAHKLLEWRALDDSLIEFPVACSQLLQCDPAIGIDKQHVVQIRQWLERK